MAREHHAIDYIELAATDLASSVTFYSQAFGRSFNEYGGDYAGIRSSDGNGEVGDITRDPYPFPGGRRFHFRDPADNELGVWSTS